MSTSLSRAWASWPRLGPGISWVPDTEGFLAALHFQYVTIFCVFCVWKGQDQETKPAVGGRPPASSACRSTSPVSRAITALHPVKNEPKSLHWERKSQGYHRKLCQMKGRADPPEAHHPLCPSAAGCVVPTCLGSGDPRVAWAGQGSPWLWASVSLSQSQTLQS